MIAVCCPLEDATAGRCRAAQESRDTRCNVPYVECRVTDQCAACRLYTVTVYTY